MHIGDVSVRSPSPGRFVGALACPVIEFRILGPFGVVRDGTPLVIQGAKERAALAILLLNAGHSVSVDHMIDALWESEAPATARNSLQVRIATLRKALGSDRIETRCDAETPRDPEPLASPRRAGYIERWRTRGRDLGPRNPEPNEPIPCDRRPTEVPVPEPCRLRKTPRPFRDGGVVRPCQ